MSHLLPICYQENIRPEKISFKINEIKCIASRLSVKAGMWNWERNEGNDGDAGNQGENAGDQGGNAGIRVGMLGIRVGMQGMAVGMLGMREMRRIRVGMRGIGVECWECRECGESGWECGESG